MFSIYIILFYAVLLAIKPTRKLALALTPWLIFACSYDWMRLLPNYEVNPIDCIMPKRLCSASALKEHDRFLANISRNTTAASPTLWPDCSISVGCLCL